MSTTQIIHESVSLSETDDQAEVAWMPNLATGDYHLGAGQKMHVTPKYLETIHREFQRYNRMMDIIGDGYRRPVILDEDNLHHKPPADEDIPPGSRVGELIDSKIVGNQLFFKYAFNPKFWPKVRDRFHEYSSINITPSHTDTRTGEHFEAFVAHSAMTATPKYTKARVIRDHEKLESLGLTLSENNLEEEKKMSEMKTTNTPEDHTATANRRIQATPVATANATDQATPVATATDQATNEPADNFDAKAAVSELAAQLGSLQGSLPEMIKAAFSSIVAPPAPELTPEQKELADLKAQIQALNSQRTEQQVTLSEDKILAIVDSRLKNATSTGASFTPGQPEAQALAPITLSEAVVQATAEKAGVDLESARLLAKARAMAAQA